MPFRLKKTTLGGPSILGRPRPSSQNLWDLERSSTASAIMLIRGFKTASKVVSAGENLQRNPGRSACHAYSRQAW